VFFFICVYIYIIYTANLGLEIVVPGREKEQSRFRESSERAERSSERARRNTESIERARGSTIGQCRYAADRSLK